MSSITFKEFKKERNKKYWTFVDVNLDIEQQKIQTNNFQNSIDGYDLRISLDEEAIKNSLISIFNTLKGERLLYPTFGCDIYRYIGRPCTVVNAQRLAEEVKNAIELWESRVSIVNIECVAAEEDQEFRLTIILYIPKLKVTTSFKGTIGKGYEYITLSN